MIVYDDASLANLRDYNTQLGAVILVGGNTKRITCLHCRGYKCRLEVRAVLGDEIQAFKDALDASYVIRHDLQRMMRSNVSLNIVTHWDSLFKIVTQSSTIAETCLIIDILATGDAYHVLEI